MFCISYWITAIGADWRQVLTVVTLMFLGDNDAILVLLLIPRLMAKCELLMSQIREKVNCIMQLFALVYPI